jgi:uncharacterized protein (TIGR00725 family)
MTRRPVIGVMGASETGPGTLEAAHRLGRLVAEAGWVLLTGGRPAGVMEAVSAGAKSVAGSLTVGVLPTGPDGPVSAQVDLAVFTALGEARNAINVLSSDVVVACGVEGPGTASEVALAMKARRPTVLLGAAPAAVAFFQSVAGGQALHQAETPEAVIEIIEHSLRIPRWRAVERPRMATASILWRRLDTPGHDGCRLEGSDSGWRLDGTAVYRDGEAPAVLSYRLECDLAWRTRRGRVHGWLGERSVEWTVERTPEGVWTLNGALVPGVEGCADLDLGFTPATNLPQLRRVALAPGQSAELPVAWLDVSDGRFEVLPQRYDRRTEATYWYEAPSVGYADLLEVGPTGFIRLYPGLWEAEP